MTDQTYQSAADCPLGDAHGIASTHHDRDDVECCDFCGFPVERVEEPDYAQGFRDGLMEAARVLREAADDHRNQSRACRKVLEAQAHELGAALLGSWANGLEINANTSLSKVSRMTPPPTDEEE